MERVGDDTGMGRVGAGGNPTEGGGGQRWIHALSGGAHTLTSQGSEMRQAAIRHQVKDSLCLPAVPADHDDRVTPSFSRARHDRDIGWCNFGRRGGRGGHRW